MKIDSLGLNYLLLRPLNPCFRLISFAVYHVGKLKICFGIIFHSRFEVILIHCGVSSQMPLIRSSAHTWIFFATLFVEVSLRSHWPYSGVIIQFPHVCWSRTRLWILTLRHEEQNAMLLHSKPYLEKRIFFSNFYGAKQIEGEEEDTYVVRTPAL